MEGKMRFSVEVIIVLVFFCGLLVSSCASKGVAPVEKISTAEKAIDVARESNATISAPLELKLAEDKLNEAKAAIKEEEFEKAHILVDEALMNANLAEAKSRSEKAKKLAQEMRDSIDTLRREIERTEKLK